MSNTLRELREKTNLRTNGKSINMDKPLLSQVETPNIEYHKPSKILKKNNKSLLQNEKTIDQCMIIIPDIHSYERDVAAYELCMESLKVINDIYNVTKVVQLGDLMECGEISGHPPSHIKEKVMDYLDEIDWAVNDFWARVKNSTPQASLHAHLGNHEHRVNNWLLSRLGRGRLTESMYEELDPTLLYKSKGLDVIPYANEDARDGTLEIFPKLVTLHGWSFAKQASSVTLDLMLGATSVIFGHTHRCNSTTKRNPMTNELVGAWNISALARTGLFYQRGRPNDHSLGFALVFTHKNAFNVINVPIHGDKNKYLMLPNGSVLST